VPRSAERRLRIVCAVAAAGVLLSTSSAAAATAGPAGDRGLLCGIVPLLDELLGCATPTPPASPEAAPSPQTASLHEQPPPLVSETPRYVDDTLLLRFRRGSSAVERERALDDAGVEAVRTIDDLGVTVVQMPPDRRDDALAQLRNSPAVAQVERDAVLERLSTTPNDTDWSSQWGLRRIELPAAWDRTHGANIVVAVLDTGVDGAAPDLQGAVGAGYNVVAAQPGAADDNGHGTSVAGIVAARTNNHEGIAGICWTCTVLPIKVLGADGTGDTALVAAGIVRAADAGARVISMSLGGPANDETLDLAVTYALGKGAILVAAAGNNGTSTAFYPAAIPGVVGVAATDASDRLYPWSNYGSWVQVAAPGCNPAPSTGGGYVDFCGTSSAAPVVAGLIALQLSVQPGASRDTILDTLERTAVPLGGAVRFGRIDAAAALGALSTPSTQAEPAVPPAAGRTTTVTLHGSLRRGSASFRQTLAAGALTAALRLNGARAVTLSIRSSNGRLVASVHGHGALRIVRQLPADTYAFVVRGARTRATFTLTLGERTVA
jgi:subtilisin family serine protease